MTEDRELGRIADALSDRADFLSGWLPSEPDGREVLASRLDLEAADLDRLLLCRPPTPRNFWDDVRTIADYVEIDPSGLADGLRAAAALGALWQMFHAATTPAEEEDMVAITVAPMMAARDAAAETIALQPRPRVRFQELAEQFWSDAGQQEGPRDLQRAVSAALPLAVTQLPRLGLHSVSGWLNRYGVDYHPSDADRPLRGLLIAARGLGMIFLDGTLAEPDRRFTLAHEVGHFLLDYLEPRRRVLDEMPELAPVVDGQREPTRAERAKATLQRVPVGTHTHLLERDPAGGTSIDVEEVEDEATLFAMELLAPWDEATDVVADAVEGILGHDPIPSSFPARYDEALGAATNALATRFTLPPDVARARAKACLDERGRGRGLFDR